MACPFCLSTESTDSYLPSTHFNNKLFNYLRCKNCDLIYVDPFPVAADYNAMYPPSYQSGADTTVLPDENKKLAGLRFSYRKHYELIEKFSPGKKILDYGCGNGNFIFNALHKGYDGYGAEYDPRHVELLQEETSGKRFYSIDELLNDVQIKFDAIRLSNVLEHLTEPREMIKKLISKLEPNGILLIEGPIETNASFASLFRKIYFKLSKLLRKNRRVNHPPTHIFFSNRKNQKDLFKLFPLDELYFEITENEWPFPENSKGIKSAGDFFKYIIAKTSKLLAKTNSNWGNTFIYVGKKRSS